MEGDGGRGLRGPPPSEGPEESLLTAALLGEGGGGVDLNFSPSAPPPADDSALEKARSRSRCGTNRHMPGQDVSDGLRTPQVCHAVTHLSVTQHPGENPSLTCFSHTCPLREGQETLRALAGKILTSELEDAAGTISSSGRGRGSNAARLDLQKTSVR